MTCLWSSKSSTTKQSPKITTKETSPRENKHEMENTKKSLKTTPWVTCRVGWEGFFNLSIFFTFSAISSSWADMLLSVISASGLQYRSTSTAPAEHVHERGWPVKAEWWTFIHSPGHELCKQSRFNLHHQNKAQHNLGWVRFHLLKATAVQQAVPGRTSNSWECSAASGNKGFSLHSTLMSSFS